jgi:spermidine/putrescine transport system ATP-binding protein
MSISDRIAVIRKGRVQQVGSPEELYMSPQSVFVAHFIGESNFLEGYVLKANGKETTVELRGGLKVHAVDKDMEKGQRVVLAIRPETFTVEKSTGEEENAISGVIERTTFEGTNIRYEIRLENQDLIVITRPSMIGEWFNIGEKVTVNFPREKTHVFMYPEAGLKEETAVE